MVGSGRLRVGVVGLGFMGRVHIANYERIPEVEIAAIADVEPERLQNKVSVGGNIELPAPKTDLAAIPAYRDGRDLIAQADVDLVDICLPSYLHAEFAVLAAEAGRHVIVEKPMALSSADGRRMIAAARANGVELVVAQCVRFWPEYVFLREMLASGRMGRLLRADFARRGAVPLWSWRGWMADSARSGGAIFDLHIHDVDFVNHLLGLPTRIYATGVRSAKRGGYGYDQVLALYSYEDGLTVSLDAAWYDTPGYRFAASYQAVFEEGVIQYHSAAQPTLRVLYNGRWEPEVPAVSGDPYFGELAYLADCLVSGTSPGPLMSPESTLQSIRLVEQEIVSIESGAPVRPELNHR